MEVSPLSREVMLSEDSTPILSITERHSLCPSSYTRSYMGSPCGSLSLMRQGELRAYHVPRECQSGLGLASLPVAQHLRQASPKRLNLATCLLAQAFSCWYKNRHQHLWLVVDNGIYWRFTMC